MTPPTKHRDRLAAQAPTARSAPTDRSHPDAPGAGCRVRALYHYPVKGLSGQPLDRVELTPGRPVPFDRVFALARPESTIDADRPHWAKKGQFVMLMLDQELAQVRTRVDPDTFELQVHRDGHRVLAADLGTAHGRDRTERYFKTLVPRLTAAPRLVHAPDGHFMDKPDAVVSLVNLATLRSLESAWGQPLDPLRLRANIYVDGVAPWAEFGWIGAQVRLGNAWAQVDRRNGRCAATNVDPASGRRDIDIPWALRRDFGHKDLGVYLVVREPGTVAVGDTVTLPQPATARPAATAAPPADTGPGVHRHICSGCYFVYDGTAHPGGAFEDLPPDWRCPDCGADRSHFRPHRGPSSAGPGA